MRDSTFSRRDILRAGGALIVGAAFAEPLKAALAATSPEPASRADSKQQVNNLTGKGDSNMASTPSGVPTPKATEVMVIITARQGVNREQIMKVMPAEIRATVKLYLDGTIRQWYSRGDNRGVVLFLDVKTADEAHAVIDTMPLSKENLTDHEYIPVGPLLPLGLLIGGSGTATE
jgi:hypothetical protein